MDPGERIRNNQRYPTHLLHLSAWQPTHQPISSLLSTASATLGSPCCCPALVQPDRASIVSKHPSLGYQIPRSFRNGRKSGHHRCQDHDRIIVFPSNRHHISNSTVLGPPSLRTLRTKRENSFEISIMVSLGKRHFLEAADGEEGVRFLTEVPHATHAAVSHHLRAFLP